MHRFYEEYGKYEKYEKYGKYGESEESGGGWRGDRGLLGGRSMAGRHQVGFRWCRSPPSGAPKRRKTRFPRVGAFVEAFCSICRAAAWERVWAAGRGCQGGLGGVWWGVAGW